jgi:hypothetical protein
VQPPVVSADPAAEEAVVFPGVAPDDDPEPAGLKLDTRRIPRIGAATTILYSLLGKRAQVRKVQRLQLTHAAIDLGKARGKRLGAAVEKRGGLVGAAGTVVVRLRVCRPIQARVQLNADRPVPVEIVLRFHPLIPGVNPCD